MSLVIQMTMILSPDNPGLNDDAKQATILQSNLVHPHDDE